MSLKSGLKYKTDFQLTRGFLIGNNSNWELSWKVDFKLIETYMLKKKYEKKNILYFFKKCSILYSQHYCWNRDAQSSPPMQILQ